MHFAELFYKPSAAGQIGILALIGAGVSVLVTVVWVALVFVTKKPKAPLKLPRLFWIIALSAVGLSAVGCLGLAMDSERHEELIRERERKLREG